MQVDKKTNEEERKQMKGKKNRLREKKKMKRKLRRQVSMQAV